MLRQSLLAQQRPSGASSVSPSQSSSTLLAHASVTGVPATAPQTLALPDGLHSYVPLRAHAPTPTEQASPRFVNGSSSTPLQSWSCPSQTSLVGPWLPLHSLPHTPASHDCVPSVHAPVSLPHARVAPAVHAHPLSTALSQSSSPCPSHTSAPGSTPPSHALHVPATHVRLP